MTRKPCEHHISQPSEVNFTQFSSPMYLGSKISWISFWDQMSKV